MAEPIKKIVFERKQKEQVINEDLEEILQQIAENRVVIQDLLSIFQELHSSGVLDIVKSLLVKKADVGFIAMEQINQPGMLNIIRNGMSGIGLLASIEPDQLNRMFDGITNGLAHASKRSDGKKSVGVWGALKATKDPNIQASINTMLHFLEGMGQRLNDEQT